jgi:hypothetical protein
MIVPERITLAIVAFAVLAISGCGPEPTSTATTSLTGVWTSKDSLFGLSKIRMTMTQESQGIVSGTWTARAAGGVGGCKPSIPCDASGSLIGRNTVSKADIELLGAATFEGVLVEATKLRGRCSLARATTQSLSTGYRINEARAGRTS